MPDDHTKLATSLIDIYEAGGAEVSADRDSFTISSSKPLKPFDIVLRVYPQSVTMGYGEPEQVTFGVLLDDEVSFDEITPNAGLHRMLHHTFDEEVTIPVRQIRILKKESDV